MAAGLEQRRDRGFTGQPALVRRTAVEAREAGFGFFNLDRVMRDPLRVFLYSSTRLYKSSRSDFASPELLTAHASMFPLRHLRRSRRGTCSFRHVDGPLLHLPPHPSRPHRQGPPACARRISPNSCACPTMPTDNESACSKDG